MEQATIIALPDQTEIKWFTGAYWVPGDAMFEYYDTITSEKFLSVSYLLMDIDTTFECRKVHLYQKII